MSAYGVPSPCVDVIKKLRSVRYAHAGKNRHDLLYVSTFAFLYRGSAFVIHGDLFGLLIADIRKMTVFEAAILPDLEITTLLTFAP